MRQSALLSIKVAEDAEAAGADVEAVLEALRIEFQDWKTYFDRMGKVQQLLNACGAKTRLETLILVDDPISTREQREKLEEDQGYFAFVLGRSMRDCPYPPTSPASASWRNGYLAAKEDHGRDGS